MISRNLTRRVEELEARIAPATEPLIVQITYVTPDGGEKDGPQYVLPMPASCDRSWRRKPRWRQNCGGEWLGPPPES